MKTLTKLYEAEKTKVYSKFVDKFGNEYNYPDYASFAKFWFNLPTAYAKASFPDFKELQKAAASSKEARTPMNESLKDSHISATVGDLQVFNNQYMPNGKVSTYYYIVNKDGEIWHRDGKFRKKILNDMKHYKFETVGQAEAKAKELQK